MTVGHTNKLWRSTLMDALRALLLKPGIHKRFEMANGEAAIVGLKVLLKLHHDPHPWDDLWRAIAAEHPFRDTWGKIATCFRYSIALRCLSIWGVTGRTCRSIRHTPLRLTSGSPTQRTYKSQ